MGNIMMAEVIHYKCCDGIMAACLEPECYEQTEWLNDVFLYELQGHRISRLEAGDLETIFGHAQDCPLRKVEPIEEIPYYNENQLTLFP